MGFERANLGGEVRHQRSHSVCAHRPQRASWQEHLQERRCQCCLSGVSKHYWTMGGVARVSKGLQQPEIRRHLYWAEKQASIPKVFSERHRCGESQARCNLCSWRRRFRLCEVFNALWQELGVGHRHDQTRRQRTRKAGAFSSREQRRGGCQRENGFFRYLVRWEGGLQPQASSMGCTCYGRLPAQTSAPQIEIVTQAKDILWKVVLKNEGRDTVLLRSFDGERRWRGSHSLVSHDFRLV